MTALDPVGHAALRIALAALLASAAVHKLRDPRGFVRNVRDYRLLPDALCGPAAAGLVGAEACAATLLLLPPRDPAGPLAAFALLALYAAAIGVNLARGRRDIDCGCLPRALRGAHGQVLSGWLVARNALLCGASLLLLAPVAPRETGWIDALTLAGSVSLLALLWSAVHQLALGLPARRPVHPSTGGGAG